MATRGGLYRDVRFWLALLLGPVTCWGYAALSTGMLLPPLATISWDVLGWYVLIYPVVEELLFRGGVQAGLLQTKAGQQQLQGFSLANLIASLLFAAAHLVVRGTPAALLVFFPSLLFGYFRDRYSSILPAVLLHMGYNLSYLTIG